MRAFLFKGAFPEECRANRCELLKQGTPRAWGTLCARLDDGMSGSPTWMHWTVVEWFAAAMHAWKEAHVRWHW